MSDLTADQLSEPELDRPEAVEFQFVREPVEFKPSRNGRPAKLSTRLFVELCRRIELGKSVLDGCFELGISYKTVWVHVNRRPAFARRYRQAQEIAKAREREEDLKRLGEAVKEDWRVSAWRLERRWPAEFALRRVDRDDPQAAQPVGDRVPLETLIEDARIAAEVAQQRPPGLPPAT
jgi:hypothetical protein